MNATLHLSRALDDLRTRMGVDISDMTVGELADLVHACDRCANPFGGVNADAAGFPVKVCEGVYFWRLTIGASVWLDEFAGPILGGDTKKYKMALVYALVHARRPDAFDGLRDEASILEAVRETCGRIAATPKEVNDAIDLVLHLNPNTRQDDARDAAADWSAICCRLETQTGIPARDWIWNHSSSFAMKAYNDLHAFAAAYAGGASAHMKDELDRANEDLQLQKKRAESMRDVLAAQVDATKKLRDAQIEYAKAQELSLAKTDEERKLIEEKYRAQSKLSEREYSASRRDIQMKTAQDEIANLERRLEAARERERNATRLANDYMRRARGLSESDGFFDMKHRGDSGRRIRDQIETLGGKSRESMGEAQSAIREQQDLELQIRTARKKLGSLRKAQDAEVMSESISDINDETASRLQGEEETRKIREETQKLREEAERARKEMADLAKRDAEDVARARAKAEAEAIRQRELSEKTAHERRMKDISSEKSALSESASAANGRLAAARSAVQQAWGWYRDKGAMAAQLEEEKANAEAEEQFEKDFARLRRRGNWETAKNLSVDQEAVRRVALARREEDAAQKAVAAINLKMDKVVAELEKITEGET